MSFALARPACVAACLAAACAPALGCEPFVEEQADRSHARLRSHVSALEACTVDEAAYRRVVAEWLRTRADASPALASLALGRAVAYPWVSRHIADAALRLPGWSAQVGNTPRGRRDALAAAALRDPALLRRLAVPFEGSRYEVVGLSYEKVLYGRADEHASNAAAGATKVPFDAQLWLRLARRR